MTTTRRFLVSASLLAFVLAAALAVAGEGKAQTTCPTSGKPVDKKVSLDWQGQRIYFCCNACPADFKKDPEKAFAKFAAEGVVLENVQTTCPVSGEKLGGMGKPATVDYKGRRVQLCCGGCKADFNKDPEKMLAKLPGEQPAAK